MGGGDQGDGEKYENWNLIDSTNDLPKNVLGQIHNIWPSCERCH